MISHVINPGPLLAPIYRLLVALLIFAFVFEPVALHAQSRRKRDARKTDKPSERKPGAAKPFSQQSLEARANMEELGLQNKVTVGSISRPAFEAVIRSGRYIVGPGDMFSMVVDLGEEMGASELMVGAGGNLVLPYVGAVSVAGKSLSKTNDAIQNAIEKRFQRLDMTVALSRLRTFPINVIGEVQFPGAYSVSGVEQVSELILKAGGLVDDPQRRASMRNIQILKFENGLWHQTGRRADLQLWNLTGNEQYNPYLLDGEQIFVPARGDSISISGAVRRPGNYEFAPGDRVSDLVTLGSGLRDRVIPRTAQLLRRTPDGVWQPIQVDLARALQRDPNADLQLRGGDKLYVLGEERWVYVEGEVLFPGPFPIEAGLTLKSLLLRAKIKPEGSLKQASLIRRVDFTKRAKDEEDVVLERLLEIPRNQRTDGEEALITLKTQQLSGRLPVDFAALMAGDDRHDVLLRDGDIVRIPRFVPSVRVTGAVRAPANIPYDSTLTVIDYIERAGGLTDRAKREDIVIIQGSTGNAISSKKIDRVDPGDAIVVPTRVVTPGQGYRIFREILSTTATIAALILTIKAINN